MGSNNSNKKQNSAICIVACSCSCSMTVLASSAGSSQPRALTGAFRQPCSCRSQRCVVQGEGLLTVLGSLLVTPAEQWGNRTNPCWFRLWTETFTSAWTPGLSWFQFASFPSSVMLTNSQERGEMKAVMNIIGTVLWFWPSCSWSQTSLKWDW